MVSGHDGRAILGGEELAEQATKTGLHVDGLLLGPDFGAEVLGRQFVHPTVTGTPTALPKPAAGRSFLLVPDQAS